MRQEAGRRVSGRLGLVFSWGLGFFSLARVLEKVYKHAGGVSVDNVVLGVFQGMFGLVEFANAEKLVSEKELEVGPVGIVFCLEGEVINLGVDGIGIRVESDGI